MSPQEFLDALLLERGYSVQKYQTLQTGYYNKPTVFQQASYSRYIIDLVKQGESAKFQACMMSGLSLNPCNQFGESVLHMVCRRGDAGLLQGMMDCGSDLEIADDYGRTPLHDACWAAEPAFDVVKLLLNDRDNVSMFHLQDTRGSLPLDYVHKDHWADWIQFLDREIQVYWPVPHAEQSPLLHEAANRRPVPDPVGALTIELAAMVANGRLAPEEAAMLKADHDDVTEATDSDGDYSDSDMSGSEYSDDDDDDDDDDEGSEFSEDALLEEEMAGFLLGQESEA